jgi:peptidylprolyl isomerase
VTYERHVKVGDRVKLHFTGKFEDGTEFDSSIDKEPLTFKVAAHEVIQGLDNAVIGMKIDQEKTVYISSDQAYGPIEKDLIISVDRDKLPDGMELSINQELEIPNEDENPITVRVTNISDDKIELDGNHPLAGKNLIFDIKLIGIE